MDQPYFMNLHLPKSRLFEESPTAFRAKQLRGEANALQCE
jgi:hypothetical protein